MVERGRELDWGSCWPRARALQFHSQANLEWLAGGNQYPEPSALSLPSLEVQWAGSPADLALPRPRYRITTEKPAGAIAGTQRRENGPLEWSYTLPVTCRLSM